MSRYRGVICALAVLAALAGCTSTSSVPGGPTSVEAEQPGAVAPPQAGDVAEDVFVPDLEGVSGEQEAELSDGSVSTEEYHTGFRRYEACLQAGGYQLRDYSEAPSGMLSFGIPDAAVNSGLDRECYVYEWMQLDISWQLANADDSESTNYKRDCLIKNGYSGGETAKKVEAEWSRANLDSALCE